MSIPLALQKNLLDEALAFDNNSYGQDSLSKSGHVVLIEDCVETSGAFVLHHLIKRSFASPNAIVIFVAFAQPFSHYDRILRKMGCNLAVHRDNNKFLFFDMLMPQCPGEIMRENTHIGRLLQLYGEIQKAVEASSLSEGSRNITVMIDDISLMEVASYGSSSDVLNFLHYCCTLTDQVDCSLVTLNHRDIYLEIDGPGLVLQMEYLANIIIDAEPLATGLATDVHGQLTVVNKGLCHGLDVPNTKVRNFHFRVKENGVDYFYPGSCA